MVSRPQSNPEDSVLKRTVKGAEGWRVCEEKWAKSPQQKGFTLVFHFSEQTEV